MAFARPDVWLNSLTDEYENADNFPESRWGKIILDYALGAVENCRFICNEMSNALTRDEIVADKYGACVREISTYLDTLTELVENAKWDAIAESLYNVKLSALGKLPRGYSSAEAEFIKKQKKAVTEQLTKKLGKYFCVSVSENAEDMTYLKPIVKKLISVVKRYGEILWEEKSKINSVDFSDITHLALKLLVTYDENGNAVKTKLAKELSEKFDEISVDEFQDINELQSTLFSAVSKDDGNLFMVGDVKQSIYRFRQAMPEIFLKRRDELEDYEDNNYPAKITLDRNFRSRSGVTENVNFVFRQLMSKEAGELKYDEHEALVAAASYEECDFPQTELHIIGSLDTGERVSREIEAQHIANTINKIIRDGMTVTEGGETRSVTYRDFCVLMRAAGSGRAELYAEVLAENNIPAYVSNKVGFFASTEISTMLNIMRVIDNPLQDIPLLAVMLSPIFGFTADELAAMRIDERQKPIYHCVLNFSAKGNKKCADFIERLDNLRMLSSTLSCSEFLRELYDVTGYKAMAMALKNGSGRNANLNLLLDYASKYEDGGNRGLSGFIRFIDKVQRQNSDLESASDISEAADVVRIMTIHKSKGLEFPVCILADLNSAFNNDNQKGVCAFHPNDGICFDRRDAKTKCQYSTVGKKALMLSEKTSSVSEELRVLYVAMTRAKERLICVTRYDNIENKLEDFACSLKGREAVSPFTVLNRSSMADWLVTAFLRHPDAHILRAAAGREDLPVIPCAEKLSCELLNVIPTADVCAGLVTKADYDSEVLKEIEKRLSYQYPFDDLALVRAKSAPSEFESAGFDSRYFASAKPQFLSKFGMTPANRGTATHKFMEFFDYGADFDIDSQIAVMLKNRRLTEDEAKALEKDKLQKFFRSEIAERIKKSPCLLREKQVTVGIRAGELYTNLKEPSRDETVVIQGYVDCAFVEDGELIIVDYKTDRGVTAQELRERYRTQLKMYEYALAQCTGMRVKGTLIYSFENAQYIAL